MTLPLTNAELAILSLIAERSRHGYEIEQVIAERGMRDWTEIGFSSIYYVLARLEKAGFAEVSLGSASRRGPVRRVHACTAAGREALRAATVAALSTPSAAGRPFFLGLANIVGLPPADATTALQAYADALETRRAELAARRAAQSPAPWFVDALFDYGEQMLRAEHAWVAAFADRIPRADPEHSISEVSSMPSAVPTAMPFATPSDPAPARQPKLKPLVPRAVEMPARTMAVARTIGDPNVVGPRVFPALYGAVYGLKFALRKEGVEFAIEPPAARWFGGADWFNVPREQWIAEWAIPVPPGTTSLVQKDPATPVRVETWSYGLVAEVLYLGSYADEGPTISSLHAWIADQGLEITGPHEEVYLSRPNVAKPKTIIRYQVRPRG